MYVSYLKAGKTKTLKNNIKFASLDMFYIHKINCCCRRSFYWTIFQILQKPKTPNTAKIDQTLDDGYFR